MRVRLAALMTATALAASGAAQADVVLFDDFNSEAAGTTQLAYAGWANFDSINGPVNLYGASNPFGIDDRGSFLSLDGSAQHSGALRTKAVFSFKKGDYVRLSFDAAGDQSPDNHDPDSIFAAGFNLTNNVALLGLIIGGGYGAHGPIDTDPTTGESVVTSLDSTAGFQGYFIQFRAGGDGGLTAFFNGFNNGHAGVLIDDVTLSIGTPEPATWIMLLAGFGLAGAMLRRSRVGIQHRPT